MRRQRVHLVDPQHIARAEYVEDDQSQGEAGASYILIHAQGMLKFPGLTWMGLLIWRSKTTSP